MHPSLSLRLKAQEHLFPHHEGLPASLSRCEFRQLRRRELVAWRFRYLPLRLKVQSLGEGKRLGIFTRHQAEIEAT